MSAKYGMYKSWCSAKDAQKSALERNDGKGAEYWGKYAEYWAGLFVVTYGITMGDWICQVMGV